MNQIVKFSIILTALAALLGAALAALFLWIPSAAAQTGGAAALPPGVWQWGMLCAALATAVSSAAAAYAVAKVGSAAIGAVAEKPDLFGRLVIFVGLAEGIAIYGLIVSILIMNRLV
jgi:V/A-type H+-transporting ATPase subunit K